MKREAESPPKEKKILPPKKSGGSSNSINCTRAPDEILSSLLRLNNHDSFSSIKDESLDIDLSACVTINAGDAAPALNGNSFSSTDFWRMLDENAQTPQLELNCGPDESLGKMSDATITTPTMQEPNLNCVIKTDNFDMSFEDKFLRPNPPGSYNASPLRKTPIKMSMENIDQKILSAIPKDLTITRVDRPISVKTNLNAIKVEPVEQLPQIMLDEEKNNSNNDHVIEPVTTQAEGISVEAATLYKCLDCNGMLMRKSEELSSHEMASHRVLYVCGICEREFEQESSFKKHLKAHRSVETRKDSWRKCPDCGKCLKLGSMWMHRKIHSDNKKYGCDICGQKFVQKINLTHHSRVHTAEKPYECPECQKRFQERSHLQRHQKYHAQTRSYRCEKCGKMYKTERCLKVHNLVHLEQRPFACNVCDKSFISNSKLKQHSNIHTGERPFKCNYCPRDFTNFPNWLKHTRRRHKVDHKTGQQLENIPSYCSKKSSKTNKASTAKTAEEAKTTKPNANLAKATNDLEGKTNLGNKTSIELTTTMLPNMKSNETSKVRNQTTQIITRPVTAVAGVAANKITNGVVPILSPSTQKSQKSQQQMSHQKLNNNISNGGPVISDPNPNISTVNNPKPVKVKRERKQLMPRQVQKPPKMPVATLTTIKKEQPAVIEATNSKKPNDFPDFHGLSLTSAEELIMEQALEMEECGLYESSILDAPVSLGETDNAISAEAAAALQFKIKSEFNDGLSEEFMPLKDPNKRLLCSSLESSPYSSPASVELSTAGSTKLAVSPTHSSAQEIMNSAPHLSTFYVQPLHLNSQNAMLTRICNNGLPSAVDATQQIQLIPQMLPQTSQSNMHTSDISIPTTQALINHFFLPMTVNMQHSSKQVLPSVETLLFSAHANASLFAASEKGASTSSQGSTPSMLATQRNLS